MKKQQLFCFTEMRIRFVKPLQNAVGHADGMVTLRCEVCKPKADVQWLKNGAEVVPSRRFSIRADGVERSLTIHRLTREDAGEYVCESRDDRTSATLRVECKSTQGSDILFFLMRDRSFINCPLPLQCLEWWSFSPSFTTPLC